MATERNIVIRWQSDESDAVKGAERVDATLKKTSKSAGSSADKLSAKLDGVGKASKKAEPAAASLGKTLGSVAEKGGDAERAAIGVADVLDALGMEAAAAGARLTGELGGGLEGIIKGGGAAIPVVGALGLAGAALGATYLVLNSRLEDAEAKQSAAAKTADELSAAYMRLENAVSDIDTQIALATGEIDQFEVKARANLEKLGDAYEPVIKRQTAFVDGLKSERDALRESISAADGFGEDLGAMQERLGHLNTIIPRQSEVLGELTTEYEATAGKAELLADFQRETADSAKREQEASKALTKALQEQASAAQALSQVESIRLSAMAAVLEGEEAVLFAKEQQLATIDKLVAQGATEASAAAARVAVEAQASEQIRDIYEAQFEKRGELAAQAVAEQMRLAEEGVALERQITEAITAELERRTELGRDLATDAAAVAADIFTLSLDARMDALSSAQQAFADLSESATDAERKAAREQIKIAKDAAREAFVANKVASISEAGINVALGVTKTIASLGFTPAGIAAAALAAAAGGVQIAAIQKEDFTYHDGGVVQAAAALGAGEVQAVLQTGEVVLTNQDARSLGINSDQDLHDMRARGGGSQTTTVNFQVGTRMSQAIVVEASSAPGRPRSDSRSQRPTGRSNPYGAR